uniref:Uncharacterized protein n=1 Tax=Salix viminalis TaxID=40686 RepID=A0A6N2JX45_SALVM
MADESDQEMQDPSSIAGEDNTQIDQEIQNLFTRLDEHYAQLEKKKEVLENAIRSDIEALNKDQNEPETKAGLFIDRSLESASQNIANVKQWLMNRNALESDDDDQDQRIISLCLLLMMTVLFGKPIGGSRVAGTQKQLRMEFQEAKNGKKLHKPIIPSQLADEDNTQVDQEIQN